MPNILLGSDHAGSALKEAIKRFLIKQHWRVEDLTPHLVPGDDYPPIAKKTARMITAGESDRAILFCGSGYGMDIVANRFRGIRAVVARTPQDAVLSRQDDHSNILVLGGRVTKSGLATRIVEAWLTTKPSKAKRHLRRLQEIDKL